MFYLLGTVFQTAILVMFIVPRLRPGLQLRRKELSGRQYQHNQTLRAHRYATTTNVQNLSRITRMRRICSFHGFHLILCCHLIFDLLRIVFAPMRRRIASSKR